MGWEADMDLILWRHAEAEAGGPDAERKLTEKGRVQARVMGQWLKKRLKSYQLLSSPAVRARETALGLDERCGILKALYGGAAPPEILDSVGWPEEEGTIILVGHQPQLGEIAAFLMTRSVAPWAVKKGSIWWFRAEREAGRLVTELVAVVPPKMA
jgi:phosphohistidine phosphatase